MTGAVLLGLLGAGVVIGFVAGLVGIGGGVLIVPFLYFFYAHPEWSGMVVAPALEAAVAHATSLFVIVPTAVRGTVTYHRARLVAWPAVFPIAAAAMLGAVAGARLALVLPPQALKLGFGFVLIGSGVQLVVGKGHVERRRLRLGLPVTLATGLVVGLLSAMMGIGGGLVAIPLLVHLVGLDLPRVAGTSLALVIFAAVAGLVTYMASGIDVAGLPTSSIGYVHLLAGAPILAGSMLSVRWGAEANQRLRADRLRWLFAAVFVVMGARLIIENARALW